MADVGIKELLHGHLALGISCDFLVKQYVNVCHSYYSYPCYADHVDLLLKFQGVVICHNMALFREVLVPLGRLVPQNQPKTRSISVGKKPHEAGLGPVPTSFVDHTEATLVQDLSQLDLNHLLSDRDNQNRLKAKLAQ